MADEKQTKQEEPTYHVDRLLAESNDFLGVDRHVLAGALDGERKQNFTVAEAKQLADDWLKKPVEVDNELAVANAAPKRERRAS